MSKSKSLSLPVQSTPKNPNAAPAIKEPQKTTVSRERDAPGGRHRGRAIARDERRCADAIRTMSKPSMEAEPMRGRTSTPAAGRQGTGKGDEDAAPSCGPVSP